MFSNAKGLAEMFERLDFQTPRRPNAGSSRVLQQWHTEICTRTQERWETLITNDFQIHAHSMEPVTEHRAMQELPADGVGARISLGISGMPCLVVVSGRLGRVLVEYVLNIQGKDWPKPTPFSPTEIAILEILFENISDAMSESWPGTEPIPTTYQEFIEKPRRARMFANGTDLLVAKIRITSDYGEETLHWLMPKHPLEDQISQEFATVLPASDHDLAAMVAVTENIPKEIVVELGSVELKMSEITELWDGDVLMLNQSAFQPLIASIDERPKWKVTPVTVGPRLGFQVVEAIDD
ncbi:FliM/FliN family flagellar motor switch protein [Thalassoglobus polymorphus]|nr:FliM/FliN family flagellar motor switch protein [Thalassoglobus polymorphus]